MSTKPTFAAARNYLTPTLRHTFLRTRITVKLDGADLDAPTAAKKLGVPLFVVTAWNPRSKVLDLAENRDRNDKLAAQLSAAGIEWAVAIGTGSADTRFAESLAIVGGGRRRVRSFAHEHDQLAFLEIDAERITVRGVEHRCALTRRHGEASVPLTPHTLGDAIDATLGFRVPDELKRFRHRGWLHLGPTELLCASCRSPHELFSDIRRQRSGSIVEHLAVVCPRCKSAKPTTKLPPAQRVMVERWRDHLQARLDAESFPDRQARRCYVIELNKDGPPGKTVYVGETSKSPEDRLKVHLEGAETASKVVAKHGLGLRHDLMSGLPVHHSRIASETYEVYLGAKLSLEGYRVYGAH